MTRVMSFLLLKRLLFVAFHVVFSCSSAFGDNKTSPERKVVRVVEGQIFLPSDSRKELTACRALLPEIAKQNSRGAFLRRVSLQHIDSSTSVIYAAYMDARGAWATENLELDIADRAIQMELRQAHGADVTSDGKTYIPLANGAAVIDTLKFSGSIEATSVMSHLGILAISSVERDLRTFVFVKPSTWKTLSSVSIPNGEQMPSKLLVVNESVITCQWVGRKIEGVYVVDLSKRRVIKDTERSWIRAMNQTIELVEDPDPDSTQKSGRNRFLKVLFTQKR